MRIGIIVSIIIFCSLAPAYGKKSSPESRCVVSLEVHAAMARVMKGIRPIDIEPSRQREAENRLRNTLRLGWKYAQRREFSKCLAEIQKYENYRKNHLY